MSILPSHGAFPPHAAPRRPYQRPSITELGVEATATGDIPGTPEGSWTPCDCYCDGTHYYNS